MDLDKLPDQPAPGSDRTLATIANVAAIMDEAGIKTRYNVIKKNVEIELPGYAGTPDNIENVTLTTVISLAAKHAMPTGHIGDYVVAIADGNAYNPVADWIRGRAWDGIDRLPALYDTVAPQSDYPWELKETLLRKWTLSAAAAALAPGYKGRGVLTLQGPQGIGKTSWVQSLVSDPKLRSEVVKIDHHLDAGNKDSILAAIEHWIVEIGELDSSFRKDVARLKGLLTSDSDRIRRPYDRRLSTYDRRTVFAATVNEANFLVDTTGNSRWWTIAVDRLDYEHDIDTQQLFAQQAAALEAGERWWLTRDEEAMLDGWNGRHAAVSVVAELVREAVDLDRPSADRTVRMTASALLRTVGIANPTNPQAKECGAILRQLMGPPSRVNGEITWRVPLKEPSSAELFQGGRQPKPTVSSRAIATPEVF